MGDEEEDDEGMKKIAVGNQERVATTTGCVLNQQHREGDGGERDRLGAAVIQVRKRRTAEL